MNKADNDDILIHPARGKKEKPLPSTAIIVPNPAEARIAQEEMVRQGGESRFLYNSKLIVDAGQQFCVAGPALGAPAAGLVLEKLIALGVTRVWLFSCCGSINRNYRIGDIVIGTSGIPGEGVSSYYGNLKTVSACHEETVRVKTFLDQLNISWFEGGIWSTDAPYRESRSLLTGLHRNSGVDLVDMEFTALCSIASHRKIGLSALFVVSDELWGADWKPGFTGKVFKERCSFLLSKIILHMMENTDTNDENL